MAERKQQIKFETDNRCHRRTTEEFVWALLIKSTEVKQEAQGFGALLDKMEENDHIKLDNVQI